MSPHPFRRLWTGVGAAPAFSLIEIVICLAIISTALLAVVGVLPAGLETSRKAVNHSVTAAVLEDAARRLQGQPLQAGVPDVSPLWYDQLGVHLPRTLSEEELIRRRVYRADFTVSDWATAPANTSALKVVNLKLSWLLNASGTPSTLAKDHTTVTYPVTRLTGPDWERIDPAYVPKIKF